MSTKVFAVVAACFFFSAGCSTEVVVRSPPPAERVEVVAAAPSPEHFWVKGNWHWDGHEYVWLPGRWEIRRAAVMHGIPCLTTLSAGVSAARAIARARQDGNPEVLCLQELHGERALLDRHRASLDGAEVAG